MPKVVQKKKTVKTVPKRTSRTRKPDNLSLEEWQVALRREFGSEQGFSAKNLGAAPVYSDFAVSNPKSGRTYRVAIRGTAPGVNYCSCPDFAVNSLGTCKHIEWLIVHLKKKRVASKAFSVPYQPAYSSVYLEYGARRLVRFRKGTECPAALRTLAGRFFDEKGVLREGAHEDFQEFVHEARGMEAQVRIYDDALGFIARLRDDDQRRRRIVQDFEGSKGAAAIAKLLKVKLYPYQREGALFAAKAGRCLLADDMGLGKTIQSIAAVEILARTAGIERVLIVCPTALKYQWQQETERFASRAATIIEGLRPARANLYAAESFFKITNYETVHRDLDLINGWRPDVVILDEAQRIKNWEARRAQSVKRIESPYAIVLTGTPLENRLAELHSIMEFVDRFHLGPLYRFLSAHQHTDDAGKIIGYKDLDHIKESLAPVMLRRRKKDVLQELPPRVDKHLMVDMTPSQLAIHDENNDIVTKIVAKWRRFGFLSDQDQRRLMVALQYMRMSCNSTFLIDKVTDDGPKIEECCLLLDDLLADPGNKAVIFSQWLGTHELLIRRLKAQNRGYAFYHGGLDGKARKKVISDFKSDPDCRILLCTDSGGVGLNLQEACAVINMDQPWNPAVLEQRIGRVHRLGQQRNVQVYHFVSRGTIEQGMLSVIKFKSSLAEGVLDGGESEIFLGGTKMKKFMESVEQMAEAIPAAPPVTDAEAERAEERAAEQAEDTPPLEFPSGPAQPQQQLLNDLLSTGLDLLGKLAQSMQASPGSATPPLANLLSRNEHTGGQELRIPLPDAQTAERLGALLQGFGALLTSAASATPKS